MTIITKKPVRSAFFIFICFVLMIVIGIVAAYLGARLSLYDAAESEGTVAGLSAPVKVTRDHFGVPDIFAESKMDAIRALGYVTARDRLFQMDLLRRKSAGRLAEIFGENALIHDRKQRIYDFEAIARQVVQQLPVEQTEFLKAYANGVNSAIDSMIVAPVEFLLLGYRPDHWRPEDSLLIVLDMFETLNGSENLERMMSVMAHALPAELYDFLTPGTDNYSRAVMGEEKQSIVDYPVPADHLAAIYSADSPIRHSNLVLTSYLQPGSNAWAVSGTKTKDGRAILANDMHLPISVPNIWYRCHLHFAENVFSGVNLPGTPLIVAGATKYLAWGPTSLGADILDLVTIEINPDNPEEYRTPTGWQRFGLKRETILVKGEPPRKIETKTTIWGPVALEPLLEKPVAIHWTALDADAISLDILNIDSAKTLKQGLNIMNKTGGPPLNMVLADHTGRIAWTIMGRIPIRNGLKGFNGSISYSWADGSVGWVGYIPQDELPHSTETPQGFVVNANNRSIDKNYPYLVGHAFADGYRAYRISEYLSGLDEVSEEDMLQLQLDTVSHVYASYRDIALNVLTTAALDEQPDRQVLRDHLLRWNGKADTDSIGLGLIVQFRENLAKALFEPILRSSYVLDPGFQYSWTYLDVPLRAILNSNDPRLIPDRKRHADWNAFLLAELEKSAQILTQAHSVESLHDITWGKINVAEYKHPLSMGIPGIGKLLDFPREPLAGCNFCVRVDSGTGAASMRLVVSPAHPEDGMLHTPGGQSGHPFSKHYMDQHPHWINGSPIGFLSGKLQHQLKLVPVSEAVELAVSN